MAFNSCEEGLCCLSHLLIRGGRSTPTQQFTYQFGNLKALVVVQARVGRQCGKHGRGRLLVDCPVRQDIR